MKFISLVSSWKKKGKKSKKFPEPISSISPVQKEVAILVSLTFVIVIQSYVPVWESSHNSISIVLQLENKNLKFLIKIKLNPSFPYS